MGPLENLMVIKIESLICKQFANIYFSFLPSSGTSVGLIIRLICSRDCKSGDKPAKQCVINIINSVCVR